MRMTTCTMLAALHDYWAQTGLPCRLEGHTHQAMETPYLLYTARRCDFGESVKATATAWFSGRDAMKRRAELMRMMEEMLPPEGKKVFVQGGMLVLERDRENYMEMIGNDKDPVMIGLRMLVTIRVYG